MSSFNVEIEENWGAKEGSASGLLFVCPYSRFSPGLGSMLIEGHFTKTGTERIPIIPVISRESDYSNDNFAAHYLKSDWPAIITGGRSRLGRDARGPSHHEILISERRITDPSFIACLADDTELSSNLDVLEQMHLTMGRVTVEGNIVTIESELVKVLDQSILFQAAREL
jgi:hypothetical protein